MFSCLSGDWTIKNTFAWCSTKFWILDTGQLIFCCFRHKNLSVCSIYESFFEKTDQTLDRQQHRLTIAPTRLDFVIWVKMCEFGCVQIQYISALQLTVARSRAARAMPGETACPLKLPSQYRSCHTALRPLLQLGCMGSKSNIQSISR